ncbi:hypothetical protein NKH77_44520 [Streptomyces sp. M19]
MILMDPVDELVCSVLELSPPDLAGGLERTTHPSWTSLRHIQLMVSLEERFSVAFTSREMASVVSLRQLKELVVSKGVTLPG